MRIFCLRVYSFLICWFPLGVFGSHFAFLGRLWASFWDPLGRLGLPRGSPWRHFGFPLAPLGLRGTIWGTWAPKGELRMTLGQMDPQFRANGFQVARLRTTNDLAEFSGLSAGSAQWAQSAAGAAAPNPTLLAPGARMTVVKHTPSNWLLLLFNISGSCLKLCCPFHVITTL